MSYMAKKLNKLKEELSAKKAVHMYSLSDCAG